jgi:hypothetical protein
MQRNNRVLILGDGSGRREDDVRCWRWFAFDLGDSSGRRVVDGGDIWTRRFLTTLLS